MEIKILKIMKYILTKYETIRRTEQIEYYIDIPKNIKDKERYANNQIFENKYKKYKIVDIVDSEILDDEIIDLKATNLSIR